MPDPIFGLSAADVETLREMAREWRGGDHRHRPRHQRKPLPFMHKVLYLGKTDEEVTAGELATVSGYAWDEDTTDYVDTDEDYECRCFLLGVSGTIAANTRVIFSKIGSEWEIIAAACEADPEE